MKINPKTIIGDPSEAYTVWISLGRLFAVVSLGMLIGFEAMGVSIAKSTTVMSSVVFVVGICMLIYGVTLSRTKQRALQLHEVKMRRAEREKPEPNYLDTKFLEWFSGLELPVTRKQLERTPFPDDLDRGHDDLAASSTIRRADFWFQLGKIKRIGDTYDLRNKQ